MTVTVFGISTCKGRLEHVKKTSVAFLSQTPEHVHYLLVDYACPDKTGEWVNTELAQLFPGRVHSLILKPTDPLFHKTVALNAGSREGIKFGAEYLIYFDADTLVQDGFWTSVAKSFTKESFTIVAPSKPKTDLVGFLIISKEMFLESGGFDEQFKNWGAEDLEFRLRLYGKHKYSFLDIDGACIDSLPHGDELRTKFYQTKDKGKSNAENFQRMRRAFGTYRRDDLAVFHKFPDREQVCKLLAFAPGSMANELLMKHTGVLKRGTRAV